MLDQQQVITDATDAQTVMMQEATDNIETLVEDAMVAFETAVQDAERNGHTRNLLRSNQRSARLRRRFTEIPMASANTAT